MSNIIRAKISLTLALVLITYQFSCTPKQIASDITSQIMKGASPVFEMESDIEVAEESSLSMIKMMEGFHYDNQRNKNYIKLLSKSYGNYAFAFLEWNILKYKNSDPERSKMNQVRAQNFYLKGKDYGMRLLNRHAGFARTVDKDLDSFKKALKGMGRGYIDALTWTAFNWGSWINQNKSSPLAIAQFPKVEAMMERVIQLDEHFFYSMPHLFFGFSFGSRPTMFGGNPQKSKEHFEKALVAYERKFLMALVMYAQSYAIQNQDRELFDSLLNEVITKEPDVFPEQRLANELAKQRARWLLANASEYF